MWLFAPLFLLLPAAGKSPASFRGTLHDKIIWMDLDLPDGDGTAIGTYRYVRYGSPISLEGERKGDSLHLREVFKGKVNGIFDLALYGQETRNLSLERPAFTQGGIQGTWKRPGKRKTLAVDAGSIDPSFRACALLSADSLLLADGETFGSEMDKHTELEFTDSRREGPRIERDYGISSCGGGFFSALVSWSYTSANHLDYLEAGSTRHLFDLSRRREIVLAEQIDPAKKRAFAEWFSQDPDSLLPDIYLDRDSVMLGSTVVMPDDPESSGFCTIMEERYSRVDIGELSKYLKKDSPLRSLLKRK